MAGYQTAAETHSIEQAVVGLRLFEDAADEIFEKAVSVADGLKEQFDLPGRLKLDAMALMGRQSITTGYRTQVQMQPGFVFQLVNQDGSMNQELTVEPGAVTFRTRNYSRWSDVESLVTGLLGPVGAALAEDDIQKVAVVEFRCTDRFFTADGNPTELSNLVDRDSPLVPPFLLDRDGLLHSHIGWFEGESDDGRTLVNLNIDLREDADRGRMANILQVISRHSSGVNGEFYGEGLWSDVLLQTFRDLHKRDKAILGNILKDELVEAINLEGSTGIEQL